MGKITEAIGLNYIWILIGRSSFNDAPLPYASTLSKVRKEFGPLEDENKLDDAIQYCADLLKREESRVDTIEAKASSLIGFIGIAASLVTGLVGILAGSIRLELLPTLIVALLLFLMIVSLMLTILLAMKVTNVGDYWFTYPSAKDIFQLSQSPLYLVKRERVASLFYSFAQNSRIVNRKARFLRGAQVWFRNFIVLLLLLTLFLAACTFLDPNLRATGVATPTITPRVVQPTPGAIVTLQVTVTPTVAGLTPIPSATSTSTPTALESPSPTAMVTLSP